MRSRSSGATPLAVGCVGLVATALFVLVRPPEASGGARPSPARPANAAILDKARPALGPPPARPEPYLDGALVAQTPNIKTCQARLDQVVHDAPLTFPRRLASLSQMAQKTLVELADFVRKTCPGARLEILGHSDGTGRKNKNLALSQDRAEAVKNYLLAQGLSADKLTAIGFGSRRPVAADNTPAGRARNRRIEFAMVSGE